MVVWCNGSTLVLINEVNLHWARLVLGWVTMSGCNSRCGTFTSVYNQPSKSTQSGHPFVGRHNEYQVKGGDTLRLWSTGMHKIAWFVCGLQVDVCYTRAISEQKDTIKCYINSPSLLYFTFTSMSKR